MPALLSLIVALAASTEPRLVYESPGLSDATSHTFQTGRSVTTFDREHSTIVCEVDVATGKAFERRLAGRGRVFFQKGDSAIIVSRPGRRTEPLDSGLRYSTFQDVFPLGDGLVTIYLNQLVASEDQRFLWSLAGDFRVAAFGPDREGKGFFILSGPEGRVSLRRFDEAGAEIGKGVALSGEVERVGLPFASVMPLDERRVLAYVSYTEDYYRDHPRKTLGIAGEPESAAYKEYGFICSLVTIDLETGATKEQARFATPYNLELPVYRGTLAVQGQKAYAWLVGQLYEFSIE